MSRDRAFFTTVDNAFLSMVSDFISVQYQLWFIKTQVGSRDVGLKSSAQPPRFSVKNFLSIFWYEVVPFKYKLNNHCQKLALE